MLLCVAEILTGSVFVYFLNTSELGHSSGNNIISSDLFNLRETAVGDAFRQCCPYMGNYSLADSICKWPDASARVREECSKAGACATISRSNSGS